MTLKQLEYLLAVAECGSFTVASRRLGVSQPALSQQVRALEAEVGATLLERPPRPVRLTSAGQALAAEARISVTSASRALAAGREAAKGQAARLDIATVQSLAASVLPDCIRRWRLTSRFTTLRVHEFANRHDVENSVAAGEADLGIAPRPTQWRGAVRPLGWDELVVVLSPDQPLSHAGAPVPLAALAHDEWVLYEPEHGLRDIVQQACERSGFTPKAALTTTQLESAARMGAAGLGPAALPLANVPSELRQAAHRLDPPVVWEIAAYTATSAFSGLASAFLMVLADGQWQRRVPRGALVLTHE
jgi:DNA-binding transcriptional LysR family regulator